MKFQVERDVLAEAVGWSVRALPARPVIPVLSGLLLQAADDLTLSCVDSRIESSKSLWPLIASSLPTPSSVEIATPLMSCQV